MRKLAVFPIIAALIAVPMAVHAEAVTEPGTENLSEAVPEEIINFVRQLDTGLYVTEMTYFYKDEQKTDSYGMLKGGSIIQPIRETGDLIYTEYAGESGYIEKEKTSKMVPSHQVQTPSEETVYQSYTTLWDVIFPGTHYFEKLDSEANDALNLFLLDEEDDDYIYIESGEGAELNGSVLLTAEGMQVPTFRVYYCDKENLQDPVFYYEFDGKMDSNANYTLEFSYDKNKITFLQDFGTEITVGVRADETTHLYVDSRLTDAELIDGYLRLGLTGNCTIEVENMPKATLAQGSADDEMLDKTASTKTSAANSNEKGNAILSSTASVWVMAIVAAVAIMIVVVIVVNVKRKRNR